MANDKIRDLPKIQEAIQSAETMSDLQNIFSVVRPAFDTLGIDTTTIEHTLETGQDPEQFAKDLNTVPDRFNEIFIPRGWVIYENMDFNVAKRAVEIAEQDSNEFPKDDRDPVAIAENELISYYNRTTIQFQLTRLSQIEGFQPRSTLAYKALDDYEEGRYHASVPVVLSILDGMVLQVSSDTNEGANKGAFVNKADLTAWDSVAAYGGGLERLFGDDLLHKPRGTTVTEDIDIPYRHGILHGQDLGYDNELVAAKSWAALFAVGEWALKAEKGELERPMRENTDTPIELLQEAIEQHRETEQVKQRVEEWEPRDLELNGENSTENPDNYDETSPERALVTFLSKWKAANYGHMANFLRDGMVERDPGFVRNQCEHIDLKSFTLLDVTDDAAVRTEISVELEFERFGNEESGEATVQMVRYDSNRKETTFRDDEDGVWIIENWESLLVAGAV